MPGLDLSSERPAAGMADEDVKGEEEMKAGLASADAKVIIVEETQAEVLVELIARNEIDKKNNIVDSRPLHA